MLRGGRRVMSGQVGIWLSSFGKNVANCEFLTHQSDVSETVTAGAEGTGWRAKWDRACNRERL